MVLQSCRKLRAMDAQHSKRKHHRYRARLPEITTGCQSETLQSSLQEIFEQRIALGEQHVQLVIVDRLAHYVVKPGYRFGH